jgi:hypothetical protein
VVPIFKNVICEGMLYGSVNKRPNYKFKNKTVQTFKLRLSVKAFLGSIGTGKIVRSHTFSHKHG